MLTRSYMPRTVPTSEPKPAKGPRTQKCKAKGCLHRYVPIPADPLVKWCSEECSVLVALEAGAKRKVKLDRAKRAAAKADRADTRERKKKIMRRADHLKAAQTAFNAWVRARDAALPCICCGKFAADDALTGGGYDAGHYLSRGSHPHLRFDERNVFKQRKGCNRPGGTTAASFRLGVIARIGLAAVEALEADQTPRKWSVEELQGIKAHYRAKLKQLKGV